MVYEGILFFVGEGSGQCGLYGVLIAFRRPCRDRDTAESTRKCKSRLVCVDSIPRSNHYANQRRSMVAILKQITRRMLPTVNLQSRSFQRQQ